MTQTRAARRYHPASLALMAEGHTQRSIAARIGCTQEYVARQLAGVDPLTRQLPVALVEALGEEAADRVLAAVPTSGFRPMP
jgi:hypothetical protein